MSIKIKSNNYNNNIPLSFTFFKKFSSTFNPVFLTYVRIIWIICFFIILYNCVISAIIWIIKISPLGSLFKATVGKDSILPVYATGTAFEIIVKNPYILSFANIIFTAITVLWIVFYITFIICLFLWSKIPWPFVTDRNAPRKWEFFKRLKDVFDVFEFKVSIFTFTIKSIIQAISMIFLSKRKYEEKFSNINNKLISPYIEEIDKDFYESTKYFYEKGDKYSVNYIKAQQHNLEANIIML